MNKAEYLLLKKDLREFPARLKKKPKNKKQACVILSGCREEIYLTLMPIFLFYWQTLYSTVPPSG